MIVETYRRLENFWFSINQKIRFLLVGGFNTGTSFFDILRLPVYNAGAGTSVAVADECYQH